MLETQQKRDRRHKRVRAKIFGTAKMPRLCVFRSSNHIYAQLIDDEKGKTLAAASDREIKPGAEAQKPKIQIKNEKIKDGQKPELIGKTANAYRVGELIAKKAAENKIGKIVFDRAGYKYHGRVKALADGAREGGLKF